MKKRLLCLALALCLCCALLPFGVMAAAEDLTPYTAVLEDAQKNSADVDNFGEAMF